MIEKVLMVLAGGAVGIITNIVQEKYKSRQEMRKFANSIAIHIQKDLEALRRIDELLLDELYKLATEVLPKSTLQGLISTNKNMDDLKKEAVKALGKYLEHLAVHNPKELNNITSRKLSKTFLDSISIPVKYLEDSGKFYTTFMQKIGDFPRYVLTIIEIYFDGIRISPMKLKNIQTFGDILAWRGEDYSTIEVLGLGGLVLLYKEIILGGLWGFVFFYKKILKSEEFRFYENHKEKLKKKYCDNINNLKIALLIREIFENLNIENELVC